MKRLVARRFWEKRHVTREPGTLGTTTGARRGPRRFLDYLRTSAGAEPGESYSQYRFRRVLQEHLPRRRDWSVMEVGCSPGAKRNNLVELNRLFGFETFGVEYSEVGVEQTREMFKAHGFNPDNVILSDFFDPSFQQKYKARFDVVLSCGFIEHFDNPVEVLRAHVNLLKPGGYLVCTIPNLRSVSYPFLSLFAPDVLDAHNLDIMNKRVYRSLFAELSLETSVCDHCGVFQFFGMSLRHERSFRGTLARLMDRAEGIIDHFLFLVLRGLAVETRWSPQLIYIGRLSPSDATTSNSAKPRQLESCPSN